MPPDPRTRMGRLLPVCCDVRLSRQDAGARPLPRRPRARVLLAQWTGAKVLGGVCASVPSASCLVALGGASPCPRLASGCASVAPHYPCHQYSRGAAQQAPWGCRLSTGDATLSGVAVLRLARAVWVTQPRPGRTRAPGCPGGGDDHVPLRAPPPQTPGSRESGGQTAPSWRVTVAPQCCFAGRHPVSLRCLPLSPQE